MDYFENTTRITEDGYAAILQMQKKQHCIICRAIGILLAIPFLERLIYRGILLEIGDTADFHLGFLDFLFLLLLAAAFFGMDVLLAVSPFLLIPEGILIGISFFKKAPS